MRLLTYNVWFAEHVALVDRVQGISDVVADTDPHVICMQEVTPNILMLLHAMPWFEEYKGTPPVGRGARELMSSFRPTA